MEIYLIKQRLEILAGEVRTPCTPGLDPHRSYSLAYSSTVKRDMNQATCAVINLRIYCKCMAFITNYPFTVPLIYRNFYMYRIIRNRTREISHRSPRSPTTPSLLLKYYPQLIVSPADWLYNPALLIIA